VTPSQFNQRGGQMTFRFHLRNLRDDVAPQEPECRRLGRRYRSLLGRGSLVRPMIQPFDHPAPMRPGDTDMPDLVLKLHCHCVTVDSSGVFPLWTLAPTTSSKMSIAKLMTRRELTDCLN
jgi:hypothetical protein